MPVMGLNPEDPTKVLPGLEACKSPNPSSLKNGCLGTAPSIGMDQFGLWCAADLLQATQTLHSPTLDCACPSQQPRSHLRVLKVGPGYLCTHRSCMARLLPPIIIGALCRAGVNLFQINSQVVGGEYAAPLLLGISKRSLLEGQATTPAYAVYTGWHADTMFSLVPSKTQVAPHTATSAC